MKKQIIFILFLGLICGKLALGAAEKTDSAGGQFQPVVALFQTSSLVPFLPYTAYQACDRLLAEAIMAHGCRLRELEESTKSLQRCGVVKLEDLSAAQAEGLVRELSSEALVQLTIFNYRVYERRETGRFFRKVSSEKVWVAELSGEIQVWRKQSRALEVLTFRRTVTSKDPAIARREKGEMDANIFGQEALRLSLLQAMGDFHEKTK